MGKSTRKNRRQIDDDIALDNVVVDATVVNETTTDQPSVEPGAYVSEEAAFEDLKKILGESLFPIFAQWIESKGTCHRQGGFLEPDVAIKVSHIGLIRIRDGGSSYLIPMRENGGHAQERLSLVGGQVTVSRMAAGWPLPAASTPEKVAVAFNEEGYRTQVRCVLSLSADGDLTFVELRPITEATEAVAEAY